MKCVKIKPSKLFGDINVPPSKSLCHRAIIAAGLCSGECVIDNVMVSEDIEATMEAMKALGVTFQIEQADNERNRVIIRGAKELEPIRDEIHCSESGSTLRFIIPIGLTTGGKFTFSGRGKLVSRPLKDYYDIFEKQSIAYDTVAGGLPLTVEGKLKSGVFEIAGDVSSQFITGLMFALPLLEGDSKIIITKNLESKGYVDLTMDVLESFSVKVKNNEYKEFFIEGNQKYKGTDYRVEGDFSQAAFWLVAGAIGGAVNCLDLNEQSQQGDRVIVDIIKAMKGNLNTVENGIRSDEAETKGTIIDASECPDIIPVLAVLAALSEGTTEIINAGRLRYKESDRLKAIATELNKLGADIQEKEDGLIIIGKKELTGGTVESWNDHRIAMSLAIAAIRCKKDVTIIGSECVNKSYPTFWEDFKKLGGSLDEWNLG